MESGDTELNNEPKEAGEVENIKWKVITNAVYKLPLSILPSASSSSRNSSDSDGGDGRGEDEGQGGGGSSDSGDSDSGLGTDEARTDGIGGGAEGGRSVGTLRPPGCDPAVFSLVTVLRELR